MDKLFSYESLVQKVEVYPNRLVISDYSGYLGSIRPRVETIGARHIVSASRARFGFTVTVTLDDGSTRSLKLLARSDELVQAINSIIS